MVFGYENLLISDGSALPANPGVNPSLTISHGRRRRRRRRRRPMAERPPFREARVGGERRAVGDEQVLVAEYPTAHVDNALGRGRRR